LSENFSCFSSLQYYRIFKQFQSLKSVEKISSRHGETKVLQPSKTRGVALINAEDFFASSPTANFVSVTKKDTNEFSLKRCEACALHLFLYLAGEFFFAKAATENCFLICEKTGAKKG